MTRCVQKVQVFAPAKINLTLHVTGQRSDGYHLLDSLVVFADVGDCLTAEVSNETSLRVAGPEARDVPAGAGNLVLRMAGLFDTLPGARIALTKHLPVASGIGGGSTDAAAGFRALTALLAPQRTDEATIAPTADALLALGADIPMCVNPVAARIGGIGEKITPIPDLPPLFCVLVNPRCAVSTPAAFKAMRRRDCPAMPTSFPCFGDARHMAEWLASQRNDLEAAALSLAPAISDVKTALTQTDGCLLARMSGSGATCFGLFADRDASAAAAAHLTQDHPTWWVKAACLGDQSTRARPQLIRSTT